MKKLVSTQGLLFGEFDDSNISCAINERVNPKLEIFYKQFPNNDYIHIESKLSYTLFDGQVTSLILVNTIDNPTTQRLEYFRDTCENFYDVYGFVVDNNSSTPSVFLKATDIYDMASLIHALDYRFVSLESIMRVVDGRPPMRDDEPVEEDEDIDEPFNVDQYGVGYSEDGKILKFCRFTFKETRYEVPDGVEEIEDGAFVACRHFLELSIPRSVRFIGDFIFGNGGIIIVRN